MYRFLRIALGVLACACLLTAQQPQKIKVSFPAKGGEAWLHHIAKDGGYFAKYGLDVELVFAAPAAGITKVSGGEATMTSLTLEQAMEASSRDGSLIAYASPLRKSPVALMANKDIKSVRDLKGKTIGVLQTGDESYQFAVAILAKNGMTPADVQWLNADDENDGCVGALANGRVDATMIEAPESFELEKQGFKSLSNIADFEDIYAPTVILFKKMTVATHPHLPEQLIRANAEAIKRFYSDKAFAVKTYLAYNSGDEPSVAKMYDRYVLGTAFERIPYIPRAAVQYALIHPADNETAARFKQFDFRMVLDNSIVTRLVKTLFFEKLYGVGIRVEENRKSALAFK